MTLLGKIFTFLILLMSLVFMSFALVVYMTQTNWRDLVERTDPKPGEEVGLRVQLATAQEDIDRYKTELEEAKRQYELEVAARQLALAASESQLQEALALVTSLESEIRTHQEALREKVAQFTALQDNLSKLNSEIDILQEGIRVALEERNARVEEVVALSNQLNQAIGVRRRLEERRGQLITQVDRMRSVLDYLGADENMPIPNVTPPGLAGLVTAVNDQNLVEVSLGTDDGLRVNHFLEVYRGTNYVGRLKILRSEPDMAVGEFMQEWRRAPIRQGDTVAAQVN